MLTEYRETEKMSYQPPSAFAVSSPSPASHSPGVNAGHISITGGSVSSISG